MEIQISYFLHCSRGRVNLKKSENIGADARLVSEDNLMPLSRPQINLLPASWLDTAFVQWLLYV